MLICGDSVRLHAIEVSKLSICTELDESSIRNIKSRARLEEVLNHFIKDNNTYPELRLLRGIYLPEMQSQLQNVQ